MMMIMMGQCVAAVDLYGACVHTLGVSGAQTVLYGSGCLWDEGQGEVHCVGKGQKRGRPSGGKHKSGSHAAQGPLYAGFKP